MSAMCEVPVDVADALPELESRVAFLNAAAGALSALNTNDLAFFAGRKAWEGLFYFTQDLLGMTEALKKKTA